MFLKLCANSAQPRQCEQAQTQSARSRQRRAGADKTRTGPDTSCEDHGCGGQAQARHENAPAKKRQAKVRRNNNATGEIKMQYALKPKSSNGNSQNTTSKNPNSIVQQKKIKRNTLRTAIVGKLIPHHAPLSHLEPMGNKHAHARRVRRKSEERGRMPDTRPGLYWCGASRENNPEPSNQAMCRTAQQRTRAHRAACVLASTRPHVNEHMPHTDLKEIEWHEQGKTHASLSMQTK